MVAFVLSLALALFSHSHAHATGGHLPMKGVVIPGVSLAGIKIGDSEQHVRQVWGHELRHVPVLHRPDLALRVSER